MTILNRKDLSTIERALGLIEGIGYGVDEKTATGLFSAVEIISEVLENCDCEKFLLNGDKNE